MNKRKIQKNSKNKRKKQNNFTKKIKSKDIFLKDFLSFLIIVISIIMIIFSLFKIINWNIDNKKIKELEVEIIKNDIEEETKEDNSVNVNPPEDEHDDYWYYITMDMMSVDFNELKEKNSDTVGFIKVNGTNINYPVVQTSDNSFYLNHAFDKTLNNAGWIFADYRNDMVNFGRNTIIYGHGRLNNTMFGSLKNILKSSWYDNKDNYIIKFSTPTENTLWQVFSVYSIKVESYYITTDFDNLDEYNTFLQTLKGRSQKNFNTSVNVNDKIITLSTCQDVAGSGRVVMHAKLIKKENR